MAVILIDILTGQHAIIHACIMYTNTQHWSKLPIAKVNRETEKQSATQTDGHTLHWRVKGLNKLW